MGLVSDRLLGGVAVEDLGAVIPRGDRPVGIPGDDRVLGGPHDRRQPLVFGLACLAIAEVADEAGVHRRIVADPRDRELDRELTAVGTHADLLDPSVEDPAFAARGQAGQALAVLPRLAEGMISPASSRPMTASAGYPKVREAASFHSWTVPSASTVITQSRAARVEAPRRRSERSARAIARVWPR